MRLLRLLMLLLLLAAPALAQQGGGVSPQSSLTGMSKDASNATLPTARTNLLPTPTNNNCLVGNGSDWTSGACGVGSGMATNGSNATAAALGAIAGVSSAPLGLAKGGTSADLSATGGTSAVLRQSSSGAPITVSRLACADLSDAAGGCSTAGGTTVLNASSLIETLPNDSGTGTTANKLVIYTTGATVKVAATTDTSDVVGICVSGITGTSCGTSGNASVAIAGQAQCVFDGATTAADFVVASTTAAGDCHDAGATVPATVQVLGVVLSTNGAGGTYAVDISNVGAMAALNSKASPGGTSGQIEYNSSGKFGGFTMAGDCTLSQPNITCTKTNGVAFGTAATTNTGTSGATIPLLNAANAWSGAQRGTPVNIAISTSTFTPNFNTGQNFEIDLTSACPCTLANPSTTLVAGQSGIIEVHQDGSGSRTIGTWGSDYQYVGGTSTITLSTAASAIDYLPYYVNNAATGIVLGTLLKAPTH